MGLSNALAIQIICKTHTTGREGTPTAAIAHTLNVKRQIYERNSPDDTYSEFRR